MVVIEEPVTELSEDRILRTILIIRDGLTTIVEQLNDMLKEMAPETAIPELDLESLPWKKKDKTPASPGDWGWILGPASKQGPPEGAEPLVMLLDRHGGRVELPPYEITYSKDRVFIQRRPIKSNPHDRMDRNLKNIHRAADRMGLR